MPSVCCPLPTKNKKETLGFLLPQHFLGIRNSFMCESTVLGPQYASHLHHRQRFSYTAVVKAWGMTGLP